MAGPNRQEADMPELTLTYKCGHSRSWKWPASGKNRPFRNHAHRDQMIAEACVGYCDACARQRTNAHTAREAVLDRLTPLQGTPRQIAYATTLRSERSEWTATEIASGAYLTEFDFTASREIHAFYAEISALRAKYPTMDLAADVTRAVAEIDNAVWWIECSRSRRDLAVIALSILRDRDQQPGAAPVAPILAPEAV
jgi:hypothetical protein